MNRRKSKFRTTCFGFWYLKTVEEHRQDLVPHRVFCENARGACPQRHQLHSCLQSMRTPTPFPSRARRRLDQSARPRRVCDAPIIRAAGRAAVLRSGVHTGCATLAPVLHHRRHGNAHRDVRLLRVVQRRRLDLGLLDLAGRGLGATCEGAAAARTAATAALLAGCLWGPGVSAC